MAGAHHVLPTRTSPLGSRDDMVEVQLGARESFCAVLAGVSITRVDVLAAEADVTTGHPVVTGQLNHPGNRHGAADEAESRGPRRADLTPAIETEGFVGRIDGPRGFRIEKDARASHRGHMNRQKTAVQDQSLAREAPPGPRVRTGLRLFGCCCVTSRHFCHGETQPAPGSWRERAIPKTYRSEAPGVKKHLLFRGPAMATLGVGRTSGSCRPARIRLMDRMVCAEIAPAAVPSDSPARGRMLIFRPPWIRKTAQRPSSARRH